MGDNIVGGIFALKTELFFIKNIVFFKYLYKQLYIKSSRILDKQRRTDIGL